MELKGKKINFLGDSITYGVGASCFENSYTQVLGRLYGLSESRAYGVSGSRYVYQMSEGDEPHVRIDFCHRALSMDRDADAVVVLGGTNDFGYGTVPTGIFEDRDPDTFYGACHLLYRTLIETYPEAVIAVCTPPHSIDELVGRDGKTYRHGNLISFVRIIREVAEYYSLPVVDLYGNLGFQPFTEDSRARFMPDGIHPNDAGAERIARLIGNFLLSY